MTINTSVDVRAPQRAQPRGLAFSGSHGSAGDSLAQREAALVFRLLLVSLADTCTIASTCGFQPTCTNIASSDCCRLDGALKVELNRCFRFFHQSSSW